ncbi:uncharacterized protein LOC119613135 [Lucilia sericata]|uniref:uncharacterized protein LOC119613135 n=1 Tax=Lucilia sericata TaxID=13632 RepID=UPI0018A7EAEF|nr:uncharacterized protein LOC119613135 [Lucilia sericata]
MKWCYSRYTTGVTIGSLYILGIVLFFISTFITYMHYDKLEKVQRREKLKLEAIKSMIICSVQAIISALFILAIVKRYKYLIIPWLLLAFYNFYYTGLHAYYCFIGAAIAGPSVWFILLLIVIALLVFGLQIVVFWFSCSLFKEIHFEYNQKPQIPTSDPQRSENTYEI